MALSRAAVKCSACRWCADGYRSQLMIPEWNSSAAHLRGAMRSRASICSRSWMMAWLRLVRASKRFAEWTAKREASYSSARAASSQAISGSAWSSSWLLGSVWVFWTVKLALCVNGLGQVDPINWKELGQSYVRTPPSLHMITALVLLNTSSPQTLVWR